MSWRLTLNTLSRALALGACYLLLAACIGADLQAQRAAATDKAIEAGWQRHNLDAGAFVLASFAPSDLRQTERLTVYIEGDGLAWIDASTPSLDPTPLTPLALHLALRDPSGSAVYLARPCQFVAGVERRGCQRHDWTDQRFSEKVIVASSLAIDQLKQRFAAQQLVLVGYSGGAAVAALIAARRTDVVQLISVAGNLDHRAWTQAQQLTPLHGSLNPADAWQGLQTIAQTHFIGAQDRVVPPAVAQAYAARFPADSTLHIRLIPGFDHRCCWVEQWPVLLNSVEP